MPKRAEIFTWDAIEGIFLNHPYIKIFQKQDWIEYLQLIGQIYDLLEDNVTRVDYGLVEALVKNFYSGKDLAAIHQKIGQFMSMAISELGVLKDSHDGMGNRFIESTRDGKELLKLGESLIYRRRRFTGTGANVLLGALNNLLLARQEMTKEEAMSHHEDRIQAFKNDLKRIRDVGVHAAELLPVSHSNEELFTQAEEAAAHIISASEDIKLAIETVRKNLVAHYFAQQISVGKTIAYTADFYTQLGQTPEYASYTKAKDILSNIEGVGGCYRQKNIPQILQTLRERKLIDGDLIKRSTVSDFSQKFQSITAAIEEKRQEQIRLLKMQVDYALLGNSRKVQDDLRDLASLIHQNRHHALEFLSSNKIPFYLPETAVLGTVEMSSFAIEQSQDQDHLKINNVTEEEERAMFLALLNAEEATIAKILEKLRIEVSRQGAVLLSDYPISLGFSEYYVLSRVDLFSKDFRAQELELTNLNIKTIYGDYMIRDALNCQIEFSG